MKGTINMLTKSKIKISRMEKIYICCVLASEVLKNGKKSFTHSEIQHLMYEMFDHVMYDNYYKELKKLVDCDLIYHDKCEHVFDL